MRLSVRCEGGPTQYAGRIWDDVEVDDGGYVLFPRPGEQGTEAWYRIDPEDLAEDGSGSSARRARYIADYLPS